MCKVFVPSRPEIRPLMPPVPNFVAARQHPADNPTLQAPVRMSWPPKGSFGSRTASPLRTASAPDAPGRVAQRGAPSQQGVLAAGVILLREPPEEGEMEVLIGRYEVINAFRSERHRKCVPCASPASTTSPAARSGRPRS